MPQEAQVKPWSEIAKNFDPMMPSDQYDGLRLKYFNDFVKPKVPAGKSVEATYAEFKTLTERASTLSPGAKAMVHAQSGAAAAADAMLSPLKDLHPIYRKLWEQVQGKEIQLDRMAMREGMNTTVPKVLGAFTGQAVDFAAISAVLGPLTAGLSTEAVSSIKAAELVNRVARGGLSFATYDALSADKGNRLQAGVKGFLTGAAFDLALGMPGYLRGKGVSNPASAVEAASSGQLGQGAKKINPELSRIDSDIAKKVSHNAEVSRLELRPERTSWSYTTGQRGARVYVKDIAGQQIPIEIKAGREYEAYRQVRSLVEQGGSVSHYEVHPDESSRLNEFNRIQTNAEIGKYNSTVVRTPNGKAEAVAKTATREGLPSTALSRNTVEVATVSVPHPILDKPETFTTRGRSVTSAMPEREPSSVEREQAFKKRSLDDKTKMFLTRQLERIWDTTLDYDEKRSAIVIAAREVPELLPEAYRAKLPPFDVRGNLVNAVVESRVMDASQRALGYSPNIDHIGKGAKGQAVVTLTTNLTDQEVHQLENALGPEYEINVPKKFRNRAAQAKSERSLDDAELASLLEFHNVKPEDVDVEAIREGGLAELIRQQEVKQPELFGRKKNTTTPKAALLAGKIPLSEMEVTRGVGDGVKVGDEIFSSFQDAIDASGDKRFLGSPAGAKSIEGQLSEASLKGRIMGSIEDVPPEKIATVAQFVRMTKGWMISPLRGYKPGEFELVYYRPEDASRVEPLIRDYDNYISQQAGRVFNTDGLPVEPVGEEAHARMGKAFGIPEEEVGKFIDSNRNLESSGGVRHAPEVSSKPKGQRLVLQHEDIQRIFGNAAGAAVPSMKDLSKQFGIELPLSMQSADPMIILSSAADKTTLFHERLHIGAMHADLYESFKNHVAPANQETALSIARGLMDTHSVYGDWKLRDNIEESFVHAATAVRYGDKPYLELLARWDTSVGHVMDYVFNTSNSLLEATFKESMDTVPVRIYQRQLWDLMRRSSNEVAESLKEGIRATGSGIASWYDVANDSWVVKEPTTEVRFRNLTELWDYVQDNDKNFMAPSASLRAELGGVRGPLAPVGREPNGASLPLPEMPPEGKFIGASGMSALWRPFFPWLATLDENINKAFRKSGKALPIYEYAKKVDDQFREGSRWLESNYEKMYDLLADFKGKKMVSVFDYLTYPEAERTTKLMDKYGLSQAEGIQAHKIWDFMKEFRDTTQINLPQYMLEYHPKLRGFGWASERVFGPIGTRQLANDFDKLIRHDGKWDPQDAHIGKFLHVMVREGMEKKFTGDALGRLDKLVELKTADGHYIIPQAVRWPLSNYVKYMRGIPDVSQQVISKTMGEFFDRLNERIKGLNTKLPAQAQIPLMTAPPRQILNRFMLMSYSMGLGLRPAVALRDMMQAFTGGMTVMGPARFSRAFTKFMSNPHASFELADNAGGLLRKNNAGELMGDLMQEVPTAGAGWIDRLTKWSNMALAPSRWGHNFARAITFNGEYDDAVTAIKQYRAGKIDVDKLMTDTSLWFMDRPASAQLLKGINDVHTPVEDIAKRIALESVDLTQWPYRRGTQPTLLRYGAGRIFGQYGVWPANYADFLYRIGKKWTERPAMAARTSAMWAAVNYAATHSMEAAGADTSKWFWQSPAGFAGSPHWDFVHALMVAPENTDEGRQARKTVLEYPLNFVPALNEVKSVAKALQSGGTEWPPSQESLLRALGFKPLDQVQNDQDWQDMVETQMGYKSARRRK